LNPTTTANERAGHGAVEACPNRRAQTTPIAHAFTLAVVCGVVGGALVFWIERLVHSIVWYYVWHGVAPWTIVTAGVGFTVGRSARLAATAGLVAQIGLLVGYYGAQNLDFGELERAAIASYGLLGLVTGPLYGAVGARLRDRAAWHRPAIVGLVVAPLFVDGVNLLWEMAHDYAMSHRHQVAYRTAVGAPYFAVGVVLICWLSRSRLDGLRAAAVGAALTAVATFFVIDPIL
jgi:hypothetical protein